MRLRRLAPPAASAALPPHHKAPRALPLPSAQAKKRRVSPSPRKAATPVPPPPPGLATSAPAAALLNPYSLPQDQGNTPAELAYVNAPTAPPPAADEKPSTPSPPAAVEEPSTSPARKVIMIRNPVPEGGTFAAAAAVGALPAGEGCSPDKPSSHRNAFLDEEQNASEVEVQKLPSGFNAVDVDETLLGSAKKTLLGEEAVGGRTLIGKPVANTDSDAYEAEELASVGIGKEEYGMSERQRRRMTEVFVCGLGRDMKVEDVRSVFGWAGEITKVWMAMDARTWKSKGYCFVRYREPSQAKKVIAEFAKLKVVSTHWDEFKVCWKLCQVEARDGNDTIILENIDKKWNKEDIMKLLHKTGVENIDTVTLMADYNYPGYNCGYAFLELETEIDAWMAYIKLSRKGVFGRCLNITVAWAKQMSDPDEEMQQVKSIVVEGLPNSWDNSKMIEILSKYGVIQRTVLSRDIQSAKRSDFAFVHYTTHEAAILCLESFDKEELTENGSKVNIKVSLAKPFRKGNQKKEDKRISNRQKNKAKIAQIQERGDFLQGTQGSLLQAQEHGKPYYIKHAAMAFSVGDWVWVKLLHRPVASLPSHSEGKLGPRFYGPYQVLEHIGDTAYRLQLQAGTRIHNVFHVGALVPFSGLAPATAPSLPLPPMLHEHMLPIPVSVLRNRLARGQWQVLVRWEGLPASEVSWEDVESFRQRYPAFVVHDQLFLEGRDVMVGMKYHRRKHV